MNYYDAISNSYNELHGEEQVKKAKVILEHLAVKKDDKLLDVGCGTGIAAVLFDCEKVGIDPSAELAKQCPFKAIVGRAEELPFPDKSFDIVISLTAIHHCDIDKALAEIKRVAKRDVVITVLKKSKSKKDIVGKIKKMFTIVKESEEEKDIILIGQVGKQDL
ncbi:methyltransferase domain-containing protein [Candidatus Woesearchaeota archaeon]|nr:methyltransferase domain-containing protein [Candidatus Woesearchaeota archaeon]